jgi:hypothetical protein
MINKEKLYEAFGELVYVVAMTDGIIQAEEKKALHEIIASHPWASEIEWSFNYEISKHQDLEYLYERVMHYCLENGPDPEYQFLIDILDAVAKASSSKNVEEEIIKKFASELTERFKKEIDKLNYSDKN